ncbi:MAG TPA: GGDEF domain-containing protein [Frateuria sp.]|uniref:tetratricopeptide repeat-containing diguanylate cyclase n=1 Tax=Frateuria sp. TaxID=2211372 RepID=UPI002D7FB75F|nr:GGDEF domain-containing protein [Frateuria sp.]HET6805428.1 GGDEF domain-containing protein [Frateuria sp.]
MARWWCQSARPALAGLFLCTLAHAVHADAPIGDPSAFLQQTEQVRTRDNARYVRMLEQIHRQAPHLTPAEQWRLRYLDAWQTAYRGDYAQAEPVLRDVIAHSGDRALAAKASALLMSNLAINSRYEEAFALANRLASELPGITDRLARFIVLANLSQAMNLAGEQDLALRYARMMEQRLPPGETLCSPRNMQAAALDQAGRLHSASPELTRAIDTCLAAGQPVLANTMRLVKVRLYRNEGHPREALALLMRIGPSIRASRYFSHLRGAQSELALTYEKLGEDDQARKAALAVVAMSSPGDANTWLQEAYELLYRIARKKGDTAAALDYYEHAVAQDRLNLNDVGARAHAYQVVQQHLLTRKLETEALSRQNNILRLQQALATKAAETGRLYNLLLLVVLASIVFWLLRLKRSQLRFKKLAQRDSLTGILNHQHFIREAERNLQLLDKRVGHACLVVLDLDHFKSINDTHGHAVGDMVLKRTVAACQRQLRPADVFGRLGGEEFGILLHECSREQGMDIANRIRLAIAEAPDGEEGGDVAVSASVGLASTATSGYGVQRLCREADAALYRAKRAGRDCVMGDVEMASALVQAR